MNLIIHLTEPSLPNLIWFRCMSNVEIVKMFYILWLIVDTECVVCTYDKSWLGSATFKVLKRHVWPVAATQGSTGYVLGRSRSPASFTFADWTSPTCFESCFPTSVVEVSSRIQFPLWWHACSWLCEFFYWKFWSGEVSAGSCSMVTKQ